MGEQSDRVCIVTGAAQGFGAAFTRVLAEAGASVVATDRNETRLNQEVSKLRSLNFDVSAAVADVSEPSQVAKLFADVAQSHGRLDALVNNAGIFPTASFEELSFADWRRVISINMDSVFLCTQAAVGLMKTRNYGRVVNITSSTAFTGAAGLSHYAASKAGVIGLTRATATELGRYGITVNALAPGLVLTEGARGNTALVSAAPVRAAARPIARDGTATDLLPALLFLVSPAAGFITGQTISVNGGEVKL